MNQRNNKRQQKQHKLQHPHVLAEL